MEGISAFKGLQDFKYYHEGRGVVRHFTSSLIIKDEQIKLKRTKKKSGFKYCR